MKGTSRASRVEGGDAQSRSGPAMATGERRRGMGEEEDGDRREEGIKLGVTATREATRERDAWGLG